MRIAMLLLFGLLCMTNISSLRAAPKDARAKESNEREAMAEKLAKQIFTAADRNRNQLLNKREFAEAQKLLDTTIADWGRTRVIGQPHKTSARKTEKDLESGELAAASTKVSADSLAKSNKVTLGEFSLYVHSAVDEADQQWRQANTAADAQAKALAAQRRAYQVNRRRPRTIVPYPIMEQ
jgi:hypothetical protein